MLEEFRELKNIAAELIDTLIAICAFGHEQDDEHVLHQTMAVVKLHREFRDKMKPLFGEIRSADYDRLEAFHRYQVKVLLDIGRTKADRIAKRSEMEVHADELRRKKDLLEAFVSAFLQPRADSLRVS